MEFLSHPILLIQNFQIPFLSVVQFVKNFLQLIIFPKVNHLTRNKIFEINLSFFIKNSIMLFEQYQRVHCWLSESLMCNLN